MRLSINHGLGIALLLVACGDDTNAGGAGGTASTSGPGSTSPSSSASGSKTTGSSSSSGSGMEATSSSSGSGSSTGDSSSASTSDASASSSGDSSSSGAPFCDVDGDMFDLAGPGCCDPAAGGVCDCDDNDANVFPGQSAWFEMPRPFGMTAVDQWDYDCDGVVQKQYTFSAMPCLALNLCNPSGLSFRGNNDSYECGDTGVATNCAPVLGGCQAMGDVLGCH